MSTPSLAELVELIEQGLESRSRIDELLVNGYLLVTPEQYNELKKSALQRELLGQHPVAANLPLASSITVLVVRPDDQPRDLGKGLMATNLNGDIYVWKEGKLPMTMTRIGLHNE